MPAKNLLMFSIDDMRAVNDWGHFTPLVSTPNIDRLAALGTTFERAITQVPLCNPSRTSVLTGLQPSETGVITNETPWSDRVDAARTLPAVLKAAGAYVAMYGKNFHGHAIPAADQAIMFDEFREVGSEGLAARVIRDDAFHDGPYQAGRYGGPAADLADERTADAAVDFLRRAPDLDQPFFLSVGITKPHLTWWTPPEFYDRYSHAAIRAALDRSLADGTIIPGDGEYFDVPPMSERSSSHGQISRDMDLWVDYIHAYLAAVSYADAKIGEVLDALQADPAMAAETAIVLWSDHGYHLGDHDRWGKFSHWREATEVPFIIAAPDAEGGQVADQIVSLVDIFPTVLGLMGLDAPPGLGLSGSSLLPILEDPDRVWWDPAAGKGVAVTAVNGALSIRADVPGRGDLRYTRYPDGTFELYDIARDPGEHTNLLDPRTGQALRPADQPAVSKMHVLMEAQFAKAGYLFSDGAGRLAGTSRAETLVSAVGPGMDDLAGGGGDDTYILYRNAKITEAANGGFDAVRIIDPSPEASFVLPTTVEMVMVEAGFARANSAANWIVGGPGSGALKGAGGDDVIYGGDGADALTGGAGRDRLTGGAGGDAFDYNKTTESTLAASDTIVRFDGAGAAAGDRVDLAGIDANVLVRGAQAFAFGSRGAGGVWTIERAGQTEVLANDDGDPAAELRIVIQDGSTQAVAYNASDFLL